MASKKTGTKYCSVPIKVPFCLPKLYLHFKASNGNSIKYRTDIRSAQGGNGTRSFLGEFTFKGIRIFDISILQVRCLSLIHIDAAEDLHLLDLGGCRVIKTNTHDYIT